MSLQASWEVTNNSLVIKARLTMGCVDWLLTCSLLFINFKARAGLNCCCQVLLFLDE